MPASTRLQQAATATSTSLSSASSALAGAVLSLPSRYSDYVTSNASAVSTVESSVRSLTYLLPGARLHDSELASESLYTFVALLSIYHDSLLKKSASFLASSPSVLRRDLKALLPKPSLHAKYTSFWANASSLYTQVATLLRITEYIQLLWEMVAKRRGGERSRWRAVVFLEALKAACRLILLHLTGCRPLTSPPLPVREDFAPQVVDPDSSEEFSEEELRMASEADEFDSKGVFGNGGVPTPPLSESEKIPAANPAEPFSMPRTGMTLPTLPTPDTISSYLLSHVLTADDVKPAKQLLHRLTTIQGQAAEIIYILRPLIYAILMQRLARTYGYEGSKWKKNWSPWLVGIGLEYVSRQLYKRDLITRTTSPHFTGTTALEKEELKKRGWNMAWWAMRGAFYENITKRYVVGVADRFKGKPLLDLVGGAVEDYDYLWSNYYFSTSTV
ncbi:hypothetical protein DV737_g5435, partial [Chaetothyriales sp. CBS 132003]